MRKKVCHIVRKFLPNTATFIGNQILNHHFYEPVTFYTESVKSNLANEVNNKYNLITTGLNSLYYSFTKQLTKGIERYGLNLINLEKIQIIHGHYGPDFWVFRNIIKKSKLPSVVSFYGYDSSGFHKQKFGLGHVILKQVFNLATICLAMSDEMKDDLIKLGCPERKIIKHYFGSDITGLLALKKKTPNIKDMPSHKFVILTVASLVDQKGHLNIIKAIRYLKDQNILPSLNLEFRFIGSGTLEKEIKSEIADNGLEDYFKLIGKLEYKSDEYFKNLEEADIFLHPSITDKLNNKEGIPTSITEAMAAGLPVISTYHAGIPSIIKNRINGILLKENDYIGIANAIVELIKYPGLMTEYSENARNYARDNLDVSKNMIKLESIYDQLILKS